MSESLRVRAESILEDERQWAGMAPSAIRGLGLRLLDALAARDAEIAKLREALEEIQVIGTTHGPDLRDGCKWVLECGAIARRALTPKPEEEK